MRFQWKGIKAGVFSNGVVDALTKDEALYLLKRDEIIITEIYGEDSYAPPKSAEKKSIFAERVRVSDKQLLQFTRKLAAMLESGLPIVPSMEMLRDQVDSDGLKKIISEIIQKVNSGIPISKSIEAYPQIFDAVYVNLIKAGESSGSLEKFLQKICINLEKKIKIVSQLKSALTYPAILLFVAVSVIVVMMTFVIPVFAEMYTNMGSKLPWPTELVLSISNFIRSLYALFFVLLLALLLGTFIHFLKTKADFRLKFDRWMLKVPVFGDLINNSTFARIAMILSNLLSSGVHLVETIEIAKQSIHNAYLKEGLDNLKRDIYSGKSLEDILKNDQHFPETFVAFVTVGEKTGKLNDMMASIAKFYGEEFDESVDRLSQLLEPVMILFLGLTIGFILVAMYLPIFSIGKAVG
jgi:type IV pilus assembly protein PilC